jgi:hypothetical protein
MGVTFRERSFTRAFGTTSPFRRESEGFHFSLRWETEVFTSPASGEVGAKRRMRAIVASHPFLD